VLRAPDGPGDLSPRKRDLHVQNYELATGQITSTDSIIIELVEADETPAVILSRWPAKPTVMHPRRFPSGANSAAGVFAAAVVKLAQLQREQRL
jgi:hypothetical protein